MITRTIRTTIRFFRRLPSTLSTNILPRLRGSPPIRLLRRLQVSLARSTFTVKVLRPYKGTIVGGLLGILLGLRLFGLIFGLIAGYLVDTIIAHYSLQKELRSLGEMGKFDSAVSFGSSRSGKIAAVTICALETAGTAKREAGMAEPEAGTAKKETGEQREGESGAAEKTERSRGTGKPGAARYLSEEERGIVVRFLEDSFALSADGVDIARSAGELENSGQLLERILSSKVSLSDASEQFAFLQSLYKAVSLFGPITDETKRMIRRIADSFGISEEMVRMASTIYGERKLERTRLENYRILGVDPSAPTPEIKRVYRSLAVSFHPDGLHSLEPQQRKTAEEAFLTIRNAYEEIMRERNE